MKYNHKQKARSIFNKYKKTLLEFTSKSSTVTVGQPMQSQNEHNRSFCNATDTSLTDDIRQRTSFSTNLTSTSSWLETPINLAVCFTLKLQFLFLDKFEFHKS